MMKQSPRSPCALGRAFLALVSLSVLVGAAPAKRPNVVLIVSDDQGYRDLGCFGSKEIQTPHLDRLAAAGVRLTSFYVTWPACTPSRSGLLTGRYPQRNGTYDMIRNDLVDEGHPYTPAEYAVSPERVLGTDVREQFLSEVLKEQGYATGCFGKWDGGQLLRFLPLQQGFDDYYGFTNTGIDYFTHERYGIPSMRRGNELTVEDRGTYATDLFRREAIRFIDAHHGEPFFLYLPFNAPHGASNLDPEIRGTVQATETFLNRYAAGRSPAETRRRSYMAAVTCMDDAIGAIMDRLQHYAIADRTLVIFLSDNGGGGGADNGILRGRKGWMFEGGVRVPGIVRWPNEVPGGRTCDEFLTALEVFPTVVAAAGGRLPGGIVYDGYDMRSVLQGKSPSPREEMFWQRRDDRAARVGKWKWVDSQRGGGLFDLAADPAESTDLSAAHPQMVEHVRGRFDAWRREMDEAEPRGPFRDY